MKKLIVANRNQKILFDLELSGQISDGHWENSRPSNHWEDWCEAEVVVAEEGMETGYVGFHPVRTNYNFADKDLLEVVGRRMRTYVRLGSVIDSFKDVEIAEHLFTLNGTWKGLPSHKGQYWDDVRERLSKLDLDAIKAAVENEETYTEKDLRKDLNQLKKIIKKEGKC